MLGLVSVTQAKKGEPEITLEVIQSMVRQLAAPRHRLLLFLQQSSVEWCSSLWLDVVKSIDPTLQRTIVMVSKFDNRLKVHLVFPSQGKVSYVKALSTHEVHKSIFEVEAVCAHFNFNLVIYLISMSGCRNLPSDGK